MKLCDVPTDVALIFAAHGEWNNSGGKKLIYDMYNNKDAHFLTLLAGGRVHYSMSAMRHLSGNEFRWDPNEVLPKKKRPRKASCNLLNTSE
jgi:hypothetical protein